jgi:hypothetical protein
VRELDVLVGPSWPGYVEQAALLARCVGVASKERLDGAERTRLTEQCAHDALALLRRLVPHHAAALAVELRKPDYDALRALPSAQEDFRRLEVEVNRLAPKATP